MDRKVGEKLLGWTGRGKLHKTDKQNKKQKTKRKTNKQKGTNLLVARHCIYKCMYNVQKKSDWTKGSRNFKDIMSKFFYLKQSRKLDF
jgi:Na+/citrate or Na+/malate symporter